MSYTWQASEFKTGNIIADLPGLDVRTIKKTLGKYDTATASLPLPKAPENWLRATLHGGAVLSCIDEDIDQPAWSGFVTRRQRNESDVLQLSLVTIEGYLDRRFTRDSPYVNVGQNDIVEDLITKYIATGLNGGIPIRVVNLDGNPGTLRTRTEYTDISDKTIYSILTALMGVEDGPEWTISSERLHDPERIGFVLKVGSRVGVPVTPGLKANAVFEMPGSATAVELLEDYSADNSGNDFMATSSASADERPQSTHVIVDDPDRPTYERRFSPSTSITDTDLLDGYARAKAALEGGGSSTLSLASVTRKAPKLIAEWDVGDDIGYVVAGPVDGPPVWGLVDVYGDVYLDTYGRPGMVPGKPRPSVPSFPAGLEGTVRAIGWQLDFGPVDVVTPILQGADVDAGV